MSGGSQGAEGSAVSMPGVFFVATHGNDSTAEVGNPAKPWQTATAAHAAGNATGSKFVMWLGLGTFFLDLDPGENISEHLTAVHGLGCGRNFDLAGTVLVLRPTWAATPTVTNENGASGISVTNLVCYDLFLDARLNGQESNTTDDGSYSNGNAGLIYASLYGCGLKIQSLPGGGGSAPGYGGVIDIRGSGWYLQEIQSVDSVILDGGDCYGGEITGSPTITLARCSYSSFASWSISNNLGGNAAY